MMKALSPAKIIIYVSFSVLLATDISARFLVDDLPEETPKEQSKPKEEAKPQSTPAPQATSIPASHIPNDYPRNISVTLLNGEKNSIQITWEATAEARDSFVILRSAQMPNTPEVALGSLPIKVVGYDKIRVVLDRNLPPGRYYYSIVPKSKFDEKNIRLYPGENYNTNPLIIMGETELGDARTVAMIKAVTIEDRNVLLTWEAINNFNGEYIIFRSKMPIDTAEKLNNADPVGRIHSAKTRFLDNEATPGRHFYAIACKTIDGILYSDMRKGFNYTEDAVFIGGTIGVRGIRAKLENGSALITWKMTADSYNKYFYLLRTEIRPTARESIAGAYIVDTVPSSAEKFIDKSVAPGKYYYVLAPMNYRDNDDFVLIGGVNVTDPPLVIQSDEPKKNDKKSEGAESETKKETAPKIDIPKKAETKKPLQGPSEEEILAQLEELKNLSALKPVIPKEEKPLVPEKARPQADPRFPWEDETAEEETPAEEQKTETAAARDKEERKSAEESIPSDKKKETTAENRQRPEEKKSEFRTKRSDPLRSQENQLSKKEIIKPEKKESAPKTDETPRKKTAAKQKEASPRITGVDAVVAGPFAKGDYSSSVTLLKTAMKYATGAEESAKAKLFIARSYIELGKYRDAIGYLSGSDVRKFYPKESAFWKDYSIDRLR